MKVTTFVGHYHLEVEEKANGFEGQAVYKDATGAWVIAAYATGPSVTIVQQRLKNQLP